MVAEHGLGGGAEGQTLLQLLAAAHGDPGHLRGEALYQLALLFQQALGDQNGHGHVDMAGLFEHAVHNALDILPDGVAIGAQDHEALDGCIVHQLRLQADVGIPLGEVHLHRGDGFHISLVFCHNISQSFIFSVFTEFLPKTSLYLPKRKMSTKKSTAAGFPAAETVKKASQSSRPAGRE